MIVTLTANPSLDRTIALAAPLQRGEVQRALSSVDDPGGKGVNVAQVVTAAGQPAVAVLPAHHDDPLLHALRDHGVPHRTVPMEHSIRVNVTITEPDGTTTKLNMPGEKLADDVADHLVSALLDEAAEARWAVLCGSLPPGLPERWYVDLVHRLHGIGCRIALDASGGPLVAALSPASAPYPHLVKPNTEELAQALGLAIESVDTDPLTAARAARNLHERGVADVLVTLGAAGAVLVTASGAWHAPAPPTTPRSTVGAGDAALAGYLLADLHGADPVERLRTAVAYGSAAAGLPGSRLPSPAQVTPAAVTVAPLSL